MRPVFFIFSLVGVSFLSCAKAVPLFAQEAKAENAFFIADEPDKAEEPELGENDPDPDPFYLRRNPKLQVPIKLYQLHPSLDTVLQILREGTGLTLEVDDNLKHYSPDFGHFQFDPAPAFVIMESVASMDIQEGRWVQTLEGYRLTGTPAQAALDRYAKAHPPSIFLSVRFWLVAGTVVLALGICVRLGYLRIVARKRAVPMATAPAASGGTV